MRENGVSDSLLDDRAMTVVIADTSPINYLVLIGEAGILRRLYRRVVITEEVLVELVELEEL